MAEHQSFRVVINKFSKIDLNLALAEGRYPQGFRWAENLATALNGKRSQYRPKHRARGVTIQLLEEAGLLKQRNRSPMP